MNQDMKNNFFEENKEKIICSTNSPDEKICVVGLSDGTAAILNEDQQLMQRLIGHSTAIKSVEFTPDGRYCKTISEDNTRITWDITTGMIISKESVK